MFKNKNKKQKGYALLEYCAGAAIIAGIIYAALNALGANLVDLLNALGEWATNRASDIRR
jgi:hypothetical protein